MGPIPSCSNTLSPAPPPPLLLLLLLLLPSLVLSLLLPPLPHLRSWHAAGSSRAREVARWASCVECEVGPLAAAVPAVCVCLRGRVHAAAGAAAVAPVPLAACCCLWWSMSRKRPGPHPTSMRSGLVGSLYTWRQSGAAAGTLYTRLRGLTCWRTRVTPTCVWW